MIKSFMVKLSNFSHILMGQILPQMYKENIINTGKLMIQKERQNKHAYKNTQIQREGKMYSPKSTKKTITLRALVIMMFMLSSL